MLPSLEKLRLGVGTPGARTPLRPRILPPPAAIGISPGRSGPRLVPETLTATGAPTGRGTGESGGRGKRAPATSDAHARAEERERVAAKKAQRRAETDQRAQEARTVGDIEEEIKRVQAEMERSLFEEMEGVLQEQGRMDALDRELERLKTELAQKHKQLHTPTEVFNRLTIAKEMLAPLAAFKDAEHLAKPKQMLEELLKRFSKRIDELQRLKEQRGLLFSNEQQELAELQLAGKRMRSAAAQGEKDFHAQQARVQREARRDRALADFDNPKQHLKWTEDAAWWNSDGARVWAARKRHAKTRVPEPDRGEGERAAFLDLSALDGQSDEQWLEALNAQLEQAGLEQVKKLS